MAEKRLLIPELTPRGTALVIYMNALPILRQKEPFAKISS